MDSGMPNLEHLSPHHGLRDSSIENLGGYGCYGQDRVCCVRCDPGHCIHLSRHPLIQTHFLRLGDCALAADSQIEQDGVMDRVAECRKSGVSAPPRFTTRAAVDACRKQ